MRLNISNEAAGSSGRMAKGARLVGWCCRGCWESSERSAGAASAHAEAAAESDREPDSARRPLRCLPGAPGPGDGGAGPLIGPGCPAARG